MLLEYINILNTLKAINENLSNSTNVTIVLAIGVATIVSIMAVAMPILINAVINLDNRYNSTYVVDIFRSRCSVRFFQSLLIISILSIVIWCIAYYYVPSKLVCSSIILLLTTLLLVVATLLLIYDVIRFTIPASLFKIIKTYIDSSSLPRGYYNRRLTPNDLEQIKNFDTHTYRYFGVLACLYIDSIKKGDRQAEFIADYWTHLLYPNTSNIKADDYYAQPLLFPSCYYYFVHKVEKWVFNTNKTSLQYEEVVNLSKIMLYAHIRQNNSKCIWLITSETTACIWKSVRDAIDNNMDSMFKYYWQVVNNANMLYRSQLDISLSAKEYIQYGQNEYSKRAFLCCAYLLYMKKYELLKYAVEYSQSIPLKRPMLPNTIDEVFDNYVYWRRMNSDFEKSLSLNMLDNYSTNARVDTITILSDFAVFMSYLVLSGNTKEKEKLERGHIYVLTYSKDEYIKYATYLVLLYSDDSYDWITYYGLDAPLYTKEQCSSIFESIMDNYETISKESIEHCNIARTRVDLLRDTTTDECENFWMHFNEEWPHCTDKSKQTICASSIMSFPLEKKFFIYGAAKYDDVTYQMKRPATLYKYNLVGSLRNYLIRHTSRIQTITPDAKLWNKIISKVKTEYPFYDANSVLRKAKDDVVPYMGKPLQNAIDEMSKYPAIFRWQIAIISFMPKIKELLEIKDDAKYYHGIEIIDILDTYFGKENERFGKYIYNSVFVVKKADLPYINFNNVTNELENEYELISENIPLYSSITENKDTLSVRANIYIPYEILANDKRHRQIIIKFPDYGT